MKLQQPHMPACGMRNNCSCPPGYGDNFDGVYRKVYGTPQTKEHNRWRKLLNWCDFTITIRFVPKFIRKEIAKKVSSTARY